MEIRGKPNSEPREIIEPCNAKRMGKCRNTTKTNKKRIVQSSEGKYDTQATLHRFNTQNSINLDMRALYHKCAIGNEHILSSNQ